jgi:hypothetical protein
MFAREKLDEQAGFPPGTTMNDPARLVLDAGHGAYRL